MEPMVNPKVLDFLHVEQKAKAPNEDPSIRTRHTMSLIRFTCCHPTNIVAPHNKRNSYKHEMNTVDTE